MRTISCGSVLVQNAYIIMYNFMWVSLGPKCIHYHVQFHVGQDWSKMHTLSCTISCGSVLVQNADNFMWVRTGPKLSKTWSKMHTISCTLQFSIGPKCIQFHVVQDWSKMLTISCGSGLVQNAYNFMWCRHGPKCLQFHAWFRIGPKCIQFHVVQAWS